MIGSFSRVWRDKKGRCESSSSFGAFLQREDLAVWQNDERVPVHVNLSLRDDEKVSKAFAHMREMSKGAARGRKGFT